MTDYIDLEARERDRFLALDGVGARTADHLVESYHTFDHAVRHLLGSPNSWHPDVGRSRTDDLRDVLQTAGHTPPCACEHYDDVSPSQTREDCLAHCRTCSEVLVEWAAGRDGVVDRLDGSRT